MKMIEWDDDFISMHNVLEFVNNFTDNNEYDLDNDIILIYKTIIDNDGYTRGVIEIGRKYVYGEGYSKCERYISNLFTDNTNEMGNLAIDLGFRAFE